MRHHAHLVGAGLAFALAGILGTAACGSSGNSGGGGTGHGGSGGGDGGLPCLAGSVTCAGATAKTCDGKGGFTKTVDCASSKQSCAEGLGCVSCTLGSPGTCQNGKATACRADGVQIEFPCDPEQGMVCEADGCKGACSPAELGPSYVGCDYYPTVTLNPVWSGFDYAVAVANASSVDAHVKVTRGATSVAAVTVAAGAVQTIKLPWVAELKGGDVDACQTPPDPGATRLVAGGAYRLRTDVPVTVYQFSPLNYEIDPAPADCPVGTKCPGGVEAHCKSYSNDASLLLPATTFTRNYFALGWPSSPSRAGFLAVTATTDGTVVNVSSPAAIVAGAGLGANGMGQVTLNQGDVLEIVADNSAAAGSFGADLSGTRIGANAPVQVISGHSCANVPEPKTGYCDHLEESVFPVETLGQDYLVPYPDGAGQASPQVIRVLAIQDGTAVHVDPPLVPDQTLMAGKVLEIKSASVDVHVSADKPILVAQLMQGSSSVPSMLGDPSLSFAIPTEQFRKDYRFIAPANYDLNYVNVIAPGGLTITLDGAPIPTSEFHAIGSAAWTAAHHQLQPGGDGVHTISAGAPFGIVVYGYGKDTSYMYPGGLDLKQITVSPPY